MKKTLVTLVCLFVLCISIGNSLQILAPKPVLAAPSANVHQILATSDPLLAFLNSSSMNLPLEAFGSSNSSEPQGLAPKTIKTVYNLPSTGGNGTIAIIDVYDDPTIFNDTNVFCKNFSLPPLDYGTNFEKVILNQPQNQTISTNVNSTVEISLDVEWAHAIAPSAKIMLVEAYNADSLLDAVGFAADQTINPDVVARARPVKVRLAILKNAWFEG